MGTAHWAAATSHTHHIKVLGNAPFPKLLHPLTHIRKAGIVIICVLLGQVINVSQGTILRKEETGKGERWSGQPTLEKSHSI